MNEEPKKQKSLKYIDVVMVIAEHKFCALPLWINEYQFHKYIDVSFKGLTRFLFHWNTKSLYT